MDEERLRVLLCAPEDGACWADEVMMLLNQRMWMFLLEVEELGGDYWG